MNGEFLSNIASLDIEDTDGKYTSISINFFIDEFKKISIKYGDHFKKDVTKIIKELSELTK